MLMIWAVAAGRIRFPSAGHEGITGKPVIVQTTNRLWQPFVARHSDQGVVSMSSLSSLSPDPKSARRRLLVVQPLVGIGDMVWHKPWIDHLAGGFDVILAAKPTAHAKTLFHGTDGIVGWLDIDRSMRGRRGRHDGLAGLFRLAADFRWARRRRSRRSSQRHLNAGGTACRHSIAVGLWHRRKPQMAEPVSFPQARGSP